MFRRESIISNSENESPKFFWWTFAFLLLAVFAFHGKPVPYSNEFLYLLRLVPGFLPNDWTFSQAANEHWFFNWLFGFPARFFSIEIVGWLGRILVWSLCLFALLKIGRIWQIPFWAIGISVFLWLAFGQSVVNDEWIFGGFEAKTAAYVCLLFALWKFSKRETILPAILLGLSFSFHPAVGLWAIPAIGLALLFEKISVGDFLKIVGLTFLFSLPGIIPLLTVQSAAQSFDDWKFMVLHRLPWHLDAFQFSKSGVVLIYVMLIFNFYALRKSENFALRFLLKFQLALGIFFLLGVILRWFELYPLLRFMPMRLFPVFTPLFFIFTAFYIVPRLGTDSVLTDTRAFAAFLNRQQLFVLLFVIIVLFLLNPFEKGFVQIRETVNSRTAETTDLQRTWFWIAENTSPNAVVIQPPHSRQIWYFSRRAAVASYDYPTYNRLNEWRARINDLSGGSLQILDAERANEEIEDAYNRLSAEQIEEIKQKYAATHLVSRAVYPYPIIFETETYKVYQLP